MANDVGRVIVYVRDAATGAWAETGSLAAFDGETRSQFGSTIAFEGDDVWIGAPSAGRDRAASTTS